MGRSKQNKGNTKKDGEKYRNETKQERRARLKQQEEAREQCFKLLPYAGGAIVFFFLLFAIYVKSVPPKVSSNNNVQQQQQQQQQVKDASKVINDIMKEMPNAKLSVDGSKVTIEGDPAAPAKESPAATEDEAPPQEEEEEEAPPEQSDAPEEVVQEEESPAKPAEETIEL